MVEDWIRIVGEEQEVMFEGVNSTNLVTGSDTGDGTTTSIDLTALISTLDGDISDPAWEQQNATLIAQADALDEYAVRYAAKDTLLYDGMTQEDIDSLTGWDGELYNFLHTSYVGAAQAFESMALTNRMLATITTNLATLRQYTSRDNTLHTHTSLMDAYIRGIQAAESQLHNESITLSQELWAAQTAYIEGEQSYLTQLQTQWKAAQDDIEGGKLDAAIGLLLEAGEELIEKGVVGLLAAAGITLSGGTAIMVGAVISIAAGYGLDKLKDIFLDFLKDGNKLILAMQNENTALIAAEMSLTAYTLRNDVILRHERTITRLLTELNAFKQTAETVTGATVTLNTENLEDILKRSLLSPVEDENGSPVEDENGNPMYQGFLEERLQDLACQDTTFRIGDVEISTKGRYIKH